MGYKKIRLQLFVFGVVIWLVTSFINLSICFSTANPIQEINLSEQKPQILPCVWMNGKTLAPVPPEPLNRLKIAMNMTPPKSTFQALQPKAFDPFYLDRIVPKDILMNTIFPYKEEKLAPKELFKNQMIDQFSEYEFLYITNKAGTSPEETFGTYYRVNPYQRKSQFVYAIKDKSYPKNPTYAGYLSSTNQYCFVSGNRLLLYDPGTCKITNGDYFPNLTSFFKTDGRSLFIFVDSDDNLNAYSVQKHAVIWQNKMIKQDWYTQYIFLIRPVFFTDQWVLATDFSKQRFFSPKSGDLLASFDLNFEYMSIPLSFHEIGNSLWFQYYKKMDYSEHIYDLKFEKITYSKEKGISATLYILDNPVVDLLEKVRLDELILIGYSYLPRHNKVLIVFNDLAGNETQAIFELP